MTLLFRSLPPAGTRTTTTTGAQIIEAEGATQPLTNLLNSPNVGIHTYAAAVLYHMANDKPEAIRKRLSMDLNQALFRDEAAGWPHSNDMDLTLMADTDPYQDQMFMGSNAGPPSIHSSSSRPNPYHTYDPNGMDALHSTYGHVEAPMDMDFDAMEALPNPPSHQSHPGPGSQVAPWYDTDL